VRLVRIPDAERRIHDYPHHFSGGMRQRVMIAMALSCNPKLLIADRADHRLDVPSRRRSSRLICSRRPGNSVSRPDREGDALTACLRTARRSTRAATGKCLPQAGTSSNWLGEWSRESRGVAHRHRARAARESLMKAGENPMNSLSGDGQYDIGASSTSGGFNRLSLSTRAS